METPSSTRRVTRSQALAASGNSNNIPMSKKVEVIEKGVSKSRQISGKKPLIDITNDSPIVGLAMGSLDTTPSSTFSKKRISSRSSNNSGTPGSGEALLRGQVKSLLQKVEEEAELSKFSLENVDCHFVHLKALVNSPMALLAPTPNNTPHVSNPSGNGSADKNGFASVTSSPVLEQLAISQMVTEIIDRQKKEENVESDKSLITRSLLFDFSEKSEGSSDCISVLAYYQEGSDEGSNKVKSSTEDDDASIWSIQVNASTRGEEEEEEEEEDEYEGGEDEEEEEGYDDEEGWMDDLCEGLSKISVNGTRFSGKHTRFVYNSDDELQGGEPDCGDEIVDSPPSQGVLRLKGLPTPKGKHFRFPTED